MADTTLATALFGMALGAAPAEGSPNEFAVQPARMAAEATAELEIAAKDYATAVKDVKGSQKAKGSAKPVPKLAKAPAPADPLPIVDDDAEAEEGEDPRDAMDRATETLRLAQAKCAILRGSFKTRCASIPEDSAPHREASLSTDFLPAPPKSVGGQPISEIADELLGHVAEIALRRAKQNGLALLQTRIRAAVCGLKLPHSPDTPAFPATCKLITDVPLLELAEDPRRLQPALVEDLVAIAGEQVWKQLFKSDSEAYQVVAPAIEIGLRLLVAGRKGRDARAAATEALAVVNALMRTRCTDEKVRCLRKGEDGKPTDVPAWLNAPAVPLALEAIAEFEARNGEDDVATIVDELTPVGLEDEKIRAVELAALGLRALGAARTTADSEPKVIWTAAMNFVFECALEIASKAEDAKDVKLRKMERIENMRDLAVAIADENVAAAISAGASLLVGLIPESSGKERDAKEVAIEKLAALLSGVASYSATYVATATAGKTEAEIRASRREALETMIDAATKRTNRAGDWVVGLGVPVGFSVGGQWLREAAPDLDGDGDPDGRPRLRSTPEPMAPQLQLSLGIAVQKLVGRRDRRAKVNPRGVEKFRYDGMHAFLSFIDLGQYIAYDRKGSINRPRWDSLFSPGAQLGWAFGTPANTFVLAGEVRYAPTLFAGTSKLSLDTSDRPGGALRLGLVLAYYVSIFDFN